MGKKWGNGIGHNGMISPMIFRRMRISEKRSGDIWLGSELQYRILTHKWGYDVAKSEETMQAALGELIEYPNNWMVLDCRIEIICSFGGSRVQGMHFHVSF